MEDIEKSESNVYSPTVITLRVTESDYKALKLIRAYFERTDNTGLGRLASAVLDRVLKVDVISGLSQGSFTAKIDDTTAHGMPHHDHSKHRVIVDGLNFEQAEKIQYFLNEILFQLSLSDSEFTPEVIGFKVGR